MVLEQLIDRKFVLKHAVFVFLLSAFYVFVAYGVQHLFFPGDRGLAIVLLVTLLLVPSLHHLVVFEEKLERRGASHFWKRHHVIIKCYLGAFLGLLAGFLIMGFVVPGAFSYQQQQFSIGHLKPELVSTFLNQPYVPTLSIAIALFSQNVLYLLLGMALALIYGAGAILLVAYNASFFAAFVVELFSQSAAAAQLAAVSLVHLLPESAGFILGAIAGAELSRALVHEQVSGNAFRNVVKNCFLMFVYALLLIFIAAVLETYVTAPFFHATM